MDVGGHRTGALIHDMLNSLAVIDDFFGAPLGSPEGPTPDDVVALPEEQFAELCRRIVGFSATRYWRALEQGPHDAVYPVGIPADWWNNDRPTQISKIKALACYVPQTLIPDPVWDVVEEVVTFAMILHGLEPRAGLMSAFEAGLDVRVRWAPGDPFTTPPFEYPSASLVNRIKRMEHYGNDARPLLTDALVQVIALRPLLDRQLVDLLPYPDQRMGLSRTFRHRDPELIARVHLSFCDEPTACFERWACNAGLSRAGPRTDLAPQPQPLIENAVAKGLSTGDPWLQVSWHKSAVNQHLGRLSYRPSEELSHIVHVANYLAATSWASKEFLDRYYQLLGRARSLRTLNAEKLALMDLPGIHDLPVQDLAGVLEQESDVASIRAAIGRVLTPLHSSPTELQKDFDEAAMDQISECAARLSATSRKWPSRWTVSGGAIAAGAAVINYTTGNPVPPGELVAAAGGQLPWVVELINNWKALKSDDARRRVFLAFIPTQG